MTDTGRQYRVSPDTGLGYRFSPDTGLRYRLSPDCVEHGGESEQGGDGEHHPAGHHLRRHQETQPAHPDEQGRRDERLQQVEAEPALQVHVELQRRKTHCQPETSGRRRSVNGESRRQHRGDAGENTTLCCEEKSHCDIFIELAPGGVLQKLE